MKYAKSILKKIIAAAVLFLGICTLFWIGYNSDREWRYRKSPY